MRHQGASVWLTCAHKVLQPRSCITQTVIFRGAIVDKETKMRVAARSANESVCLLRFAKRGSTRRLKDCGSGHSHMIVANEPSPQMSYWKGLRETDVARGSEIGLGVRLSVECGRLKPDVCCPKCRGYSTQMVVVGNVLASQQCVSGTWRERAHARCNVISTPSYFSGHQIWTRYAVNNVAVSRKQP